VTAVVVGMGNRMRRDDGVGPAVVAALRAAGAAATLAELGDHASRVVEVLEGADTAVIVDAIRAGDEVGAVRRFDGDRLPEDGFPRASTHTLPLPEALRLAAALGVAPRVFVVGVEAGDLSHGEGLTPAVAAAVPRAADLVLEIINGASDA
jgi:hydrogenase maturation protease